MECCFLFSHNDLIFDFLAPYLKDISTNRINNAANKNNYPFGDLYNKRSSSLTISENNVKGNLISNFKNPFIKMNSKNKNF